VATEEMMDDAHVGGVEVVVGGEWEEKEMVSLRSGYWRHKSQTIKVTISSKESY
jgi:hypothetical protein